MDMFANEAKTVAFTKGKTVRLYRRTLGRNVVAAAAAAVVALSQRTCGLWPWMLWECSALR
jgi:hypothetical protein